LFQRNNKQEGFFQSFKIRILVLLMLFLTAFAGYHFLKTKQKQIKINKEIAELQEQIDEFEGKNRKLEELANYLQTDDFKEREAKEKLNLVKEGEKVVIVKKSEIEKTIDSFEEKKPEVEISRSNYYYWWKYFFGIRTETSSTNSLQEN
jgi:cell division protein FtsB